MPTLEPPQFIAGSMSDSGLGEDEHGRAMTENYYKCIEEIRKLIRIKG
jgi:hypothetical protein